jgi:hypothetical protein
MDFIRINLARLGFALGILLGVQAPNLVMQYEHRVVAHLSEATQNFAGFQKIADAYFGGKVTELIRHHEQSSDPVFHAEAAPIRKLWQRLQHLRSEQAALDGSFAGALAHVALAADPELRRETISGYAATVPLTMNAIVCGLIAAFLCGALLDGLWSLLAFGLWRLRHRSAIRQLRQKSFAAASK